VRHLWGEDAMRIVISVVGIVPRPAMGWPKDWPVPREGEVVEHPDAGPLYVRHVVWYPYGDHEDMDPYVYVVLGKTPAGGA
jgi:hypothetical protein